MKNTVHTHAEHLPKFFRDRVETYLVGVNGVGFSEPLLLEFAALSTPQGMDAVQATVWVGEEMVDMTFNPEVHIVVETHN